MNCGGQEKPGADEQKKQQNYSLNGCSGEEISRMSRTLHYVVYISNDAFEKVLLSIFYNYTTTVPKSIFFVYPFLSDPS